MSHTKPGPAAATVALAALACITTARPSEPEETLELEHLVVTASRRSEPAFEAAGSVTVISGEEIRASLAEDLVEVLRLQAGIDMVRTGGPGAQTSLFMRGGNSNHVLVLVDGVRVSSPHTGAYAWEQLPLNQVERIEIVRGPRASLYGSDAIGGVIQVFTRRELGRRMRLTAGSHDTVELEAGLGFGSQHANFGISAAHRETDGVSAQNPGGYSYHPDNDGLEASNAAINGSWETGPGTLGFMLLASRSETEFDEGVSDARQSLAALAWDGSLKPGWEYRLQAGWADDELDSDFGFFATGFASTRFDLSWQNRLQLAGGSLGFGLDYHDETGVSAGSYDVGRDNAGLYLLWEPRLSTVDVQMSARLDENSEFGSEFTWQASAARDVGRSGRLTGLAGTAFRAPSLGEQFSPGFGGLFAGNPLLRPESSETLELVYRHRLGPAATLSISAHDTRVSQLIAFSGPGFGAINVDNASLRGIEFEYSLGTEDWSIRASATLQEAEDRATGGALLRRPDRKASLAIDRRFAGGAWIGGDWFVSGSRLDVGNRELPGYGIFSLRGGYPLSQSLRVELRLENLLDADYEPAAGFNGLERSGFLSLNWQP
ncbi:MAG: TonB-dependent receptor [Xanthomonadales bacterium]|nr:TonB-dependent receptor [Xanthomonadales bacterium]NIX12173.1 TonB-dependent receptor [Xanthomonadales bacterium]